jgi:hypothetical protein
VVATTEPSDTRIVESPTRPDNCDSLDNCFRPSSTAAEPDEASAYSKDEVIELIRVHSASYGLDPALPLAIAKCESGYRWDAKNATSSASGVFQYLSGTWANTPAGREGISVFDADANIRMAIAAIATSGTTPWNASKPCWTT